MTAPRLVIRTALAALLALPAAAPAAENRHSDSMSFVKNLPYAMPDKYKQKVPYGTDVEFATMKGKRYAFAGSEKNGLQIVDITVPERARVVTAYDCAVSQGDTQVFKRGSRTYVTYTNDYEATKVTASSRCYTEAERRFDAIDDEGNARLGTMIVDVTNPNNPKVASFVAFPRGSHNMTVHPSGDYLYNSNSDLVIDATLPAIEVVDIRNLSKPTQTASVSLLPLPGLGADSHDITFNEEGTRAYSAAISHGVILDTTDPAKPTVISEFDDEAINVWHQADPVTIAGRDFLIVEDEVAGASGPAACPTGGVHIFDISEEAVPVKVGYWNIDDVEVRDDRHPLDTCTAHVFDIHEDEQIMTIAYYMGGVRVLDLSGLADLPINVGQGETEIPGAIRQIGHYVFTDSNSWSAKTPVIEPDGDFYLYSDDINRGLDIFRFDASRAPSSEAGTFTSAAASDRQALGLPTLTRRSAKQQSPRLCLLKRVNR
ncbi:MAG TPA: hypothetical protein VGW10_15705 [Solirubrobacteraceae bacterium]|nr:hypothetical protein [Solirubrobacteraceae bacterium]